MKENVEYFMYYFNKNTVYNYEDRERNVIITFLSLSSKLYVLLIY